MRNAYENSTSADYCFVAAVLESSLPKKVTPVLRSSRLALASHKRVLISIFACLFVFLFLPFQALAAQVYTEDMTWQEIASAVKGGATTIIIPTGGTEQNGPHMVTGKHNYILKHTSGKIAEKLGNALAAPVLAYVPEGNISPPEGHMRFPGTISLREETFEAVLEDAARSFKQHGFRLICFVG